MAEQSVSPLQEDPVSRSGSSYSRVQEAALSSSEILFQDAFECAVKIVVDNKSMEVEKIKANFVPKEEFSMASICVEPDAMDEWILARFSEEYVRVTTEVIEGGIVPLDATLPEDIDVKAAAVMDEKQEGSETMDIGTTEPEVAKRPNPHSSIQYAGKDDGGNEEKHQIQFNNTNQKVITPRRTKVISADEVKPAVEQTVPPKQTRTIDYEESEKTTVQPLEKVTIPSRGKVHFKGENEAEDEVVVKELKIEPVAEIASNTSNDIIETIDILPTVSEQNKVIEHTTDGLIEVSFGQPKPKSAREIRMDKNQNNSLKNATTAPDNETSSHDEVFKIGQVQTSQVKQKVKKDILLTAEYIEAEVGDLEESLYQKATASVDK
ncbi:hypothetical protein AB0N28_31375 [Streptomyces sp. NPDC051130]|uniref:hypothetical protein n=1 Tax=Streptomyces sp. NPDC051130 TaxID=3157223 RepID=UPI00344897D5